MQPRIHLSLSTLAAINPSVIRSIQQWAPRLHITAFNLRVHIDTGKLIPSLILEDTNTPIFSGQDILDWQKRIQSEIKLKPVKISKPSTVPVERGYRVTFTATPIELDTIKNLLTNMSLEYTISKMNFNIRRLQISPSD